MAASKKKKKVAPKKVATKKPVKKATSPVKKVAKKLVATAKKVVAKATAVPKKLASTTVLKPLENRLLVEVEGVSDRTAGGLYIPATVSGERPNRGHVVAKGPGKRNKKGELRPLDVNVGDAVLFPEYAGTKVTLEGRELLILTEDDVLGIADH